MVANKITLNGQSLIDLTNDNITANDVKEGVKFHLPDGTQGVGTLKSFGVHIGSDSPPEDATIWIDPNAEPTPTEEWEIEMLDGTIIVKTVVVTESEG